MKNSIEPCIALLLRLALLIVALMMCSAVSAEPYLAVKTGMKCSSCHVNPIGGGKRNQYGVIYGQTTLTATLAAKAPPPLIDLGSLNDSISLGGDLRAQLRYLDSKRDDELAFSTQTGQLYVEVAPANSPVKVYIDEQLAPGGAVNREAFVMVQTEKKDWYVKAGQIMLPFGHRLEDDTAFTRQATGVNFANRDNGLELGYETLRSFTTLTMTNGSGGASDTDRNKQVVLRTEYYQSAWRVGSSVLHNASDDGDRSMIAAFGGARIGPVVLLLEYDRIKDRSLTAFSEQDVAFLELNYEPIAGHNLKVTHEYLNPDLDVDENERVRNSVLWEFTPFPYLQIRSGVRVSEGIPQSVEHNTKEGFMQLHAYF